MVCWLYTTPVSLGVVSFIAQKHQERLCPPNIYLIGRLTNDQATIKTL